MPFHSLSRAPSCVSLCSNHGSFSLKAASFSRAGTCLPISVTPAPHSDRASSPRGPVGVGGEAGARSHVAVKRVGVASRAEDSCPAPVQCPFCLERPAPSTVETGICRGRQVTRCCFLSRTSTVSTTARCAGRRQVWAGARPAASCPLPCVWFPDSPITTPSRTASPGELHTLPEKLACAPSRRPPPWAARLLRSHAHIFLLLV